MKRKDFGAWTTTLLAMGLLIPSAVLASDTHSASRTRIDIKDVALQDGGVLQGLAIDAQGRPLAAQQVRIRAQNETVSTVQTDANGRFAVRGLRAGTYSIEAASGVSMFRLWAPRTAPPSAELGALLESGHQMTVRGQGTDYGPAIRGAVLGGLAVGGAYWALDYNASGS